MSLVRIKKNPARVERFMGLPLEATDIISKGRQLAAKGVSAFPKSLDLPTVAQLITKLTFDTLSRSSRPEKAQSAAGRGGARLRSAAAAIRGRRRLRHRGRSVLGTGARAALPLRSLTHDEGAWRYRAIWAHDRAGERAAFEALLDFFHERLARHPNLHVYHYGAYEPTALKQLMGVYATREDAVDALLRREVFVDLHRVVRQGLRAGVPGYSLKEVEALPAFEWRADVTSGTRAVLAYEQWMETHAATRLDEIAAYNEEDCRATLALRDWLLEHRPDDARWAAPPDARPVDDDRQKTDAQREALRQALFDGAVAESPRWLAAELLEYHRREARPAWWWFYDRCQMSAEELVEDGEAIGRLRSEGVPRANRSKEHRFRFEAQQH